MERQCHVLFGYVWLNCTVRVQSVTWAADYGCPCGWWCGWTCSPSDPSVRGWVTLTFDSSAVKGEGDSVGCVVLLLPRPVDTALKPV